MKILVFSALYPPYSTGGAERSVSLIARGLASRGHDVAVLTLHEGKTVKRDTLDGVRVIYQPLHNLYWPFGENPNHSLLFKTCFHVADTLNVAMARIVRATMQAESPDIVLSNNLVGFSSLALRPIHQAGIPMLHSLRDYYFLCPKSTMFRNDKPCARQCVDCRVLAYPRRLMSRYVDAVTGVSQFIIDRHRNLGAFSNAIALPPILSAVDAPAILPDAPPRRAGMPVRFGYIGRVAPAKGVDLLLDALQTIDPSQWTLVVAGRSSTEYLAHLRQRCAGLPVEFAGFIPASQFYRSVDVVIVPSVWEEPLPRTVLEAFGYGLSVIGSTRGGIPEVLKPGKTGYLVDLDKPEQMADAIRQVIADPAAGRALGKAGRDLVIGRTAQAVAADYERASLQVIAHVRGAKLSTARATV